MKHRYIGLIYHVLHQSIYFGNCPILVNKKIDFKKELVTRRYRNAFPDWLKLLIFTKIYRILYQINKFMYGIILIPASKKKSVIEKIIKSQEFQASQTYSDLLQYLLKYHLRNEIPKESIIAIEFFNQKLAYNSAEESTVRKHMYKLRNKLELYYKAEGKKDHVAIIIPKGHYAMLFYEVGKNRVVKNLRPSLFVAFTLLIGISTIIFWHKIPKIENPIQKSDPIWKLFFKNDYPCNIVIGDYFVFEEKSPVDDRYRRIMDFKMVSRDQYLEYKTRNPDVKTREAVLGELPHNIIFNLKDIIHVMYSFNQSFKIKFTTTFEYSDLKKINNIYIGSFKNLRILNDLIKIIPAYIEYEKRRITLFSDKMDTLEILQTSNENLNKLKNYNLDYGLIAKLPGLHRENYLFITGFGYMSQIDLVNILSSRETLKQLENDILQYSSEIPEYFCAVFELSGYELTPYSRELILFKTIDRNTYLESFKQVLTKEYNQ